MTETTTNCKPLISVIVPVYNVEKYLAQCLDSLINQTYKELEIICVNDGSPDNSLAILEKYAKKDARIQIISIENSGLSAARNIGFKHATGKYVSFIDSDDWCDLNMMGKLFSLIEDIDTDFVTCAVAIFNDSKQQTVSNHYYALNMYPDEWQEKKLGRNELGFFNVPVIACNKFYKRSYLLENNLLFIEGIYCEDNFFFTDTFFSMKSFGFIKDRLYYYRTNRAGSITSNINDTQNVRFRIWNYRYEKMKDHPSFFEANEINFWKDIARGAKWVYKPLTNKNAENLYQKVRAFFFEHPLTTMEADVFYEEEQLIYKNCQSVKEMLRTRKRGRKINLFIRRLYLYDKNKYKYYLGNICVYSKKVKR